MPAPLGKPVVVDEPDNPELPSNLPGPGEFLFYDEDFEPETAPKYALADSDQVLFCPHFSPPQVAAWVFARDPEWIRVQLTRRKPPVLNGAELHFRRLAGGRGNPESQGERRLTLPDIERLAWGLYAKGTIDGRKLQHAITIVTAVARQYGVNPRERTRQ